MFTGVLNSLEDPSSTLLIKALILSLSVSLCCSFVLLSIASSSSFTSLIFNFDKNLSMRSLKTGGCNLLALPLGFGECLPEDYDLLTKTGSVSVKAALSCNSACVCVLTTDTSLLFSCIVLNIIHIKPL